MAPIRVLVVDDSALVRKLLTDILKAEPGIEVVGTAQNGRVAVEKLPQLTPDVITLDIEMPEWDGLRTLKAIRETHPKLPVIMFSTLTERAATTTLDALALGASDYVTKPTGSENLVASMDYVREQLVPKIRALGTRHAPLIAKPSPPSLPPARVAAPAAIAIRPAGGVAGATSAAPIDAIVVGTSTGGPNALATVIPRIARETKLPILIVQHMPPVFTRQLAARLSTLSGIEVREAAQGDVVTPGNAWVAPGDFHMTVRREAGRVVIGLNQQAHENSCRPAVDVLFRSAAAVYGRGTLAVVLTGMGQDGYGGVQAIRAAGGQVVVQDEATSVVWGMPGVIAKNNLAHAVLPLDMIDGEVLRRARVGRPVTELMTPLKENARGY